MTTYLLLGSNEGDRLQWLKEAMEQIEASCGSITNKSAIYSTAAWGLEEQPDFLNMAIAVDTQLTALRLLEEIQKIELDLGRQRTVKWGQRTLDIDILFFGDEILDVQELKVPHPAMQDRRFVLVPLSEIAGAFIHPLLCKTVAQLLTDCTDELEVVKLTD